MLILVLVLCLVSAGVAQNNGTFVVTAPKIARVGTSYTVNVLLTEQRNSIQTGSIVFTHEKDKSQMKTVAFSVDPAAYKTDVQIDFSPGELKLGKYYMKLLLDGLSIRASHEIELKGGSGAILVQTDKGIYKRSQTVKMRTFIMDVDLKAVKKLMDITIIDPDGNKVAQFKNQTSTSGVVTQEYTLSNDPKLGLWKIAVQQTDGKGSAAERNFTVDAYVLPRFSVEVKPSVSFLYVKDFSSVNIEVEALYNYGEGVHGRVLLKYLLNGTTRQKSQRLVDGKGTITISTADIGDPSLLRQKFCGQYCYYSYQRSFPMSIVAEVIEDETEEKQQGRTNLNFYTEPVAMEIIDKKVYRKNMKHTFYLHVTDPSGAPLPMGERTKYFVNVLDRNREMLNFRKLPLDTSVADIMMSFTTEKPITRDLNIEVNLVDENNVVILKEYGNPQQYQSFGSEGVLITLMETSSGDNSGQTFFV